MINTMFGVLMAKLAEMAETKLDKADQNYAIAKSYEKSGHPILAKKYKQKAADKYEQAGKAGMPKNAKLTMDSIEDQLGYYLNDKEEIPVRQMIAEQKNKRFALRHPFLTGIPTLGLAPIISQSNATNEIVRQLIKSNPIFQKAYIQKLKDDREYRTRLYEADAPSRAMHDKYLYKNLYSTEKKAGIEDTMALKKNDKNTINFITEKGYKQVDKNTYLKKDKEFFNQVANNHKNKVRAINIASSAVLGAIGTGIGAAGFQRIVPALGIGAIGVGIGGLIAHENKEKLKKALDDVETTFVLDRDKVTKNKNYNYYIKEAQIKKIAISDLKLLQYIKKVAPDRLAPLSKELKRIRNTSLTPDKDISNVISGEAKVQEVIRNIRKDRGIASKALHSALQESVKLPARMKSYENLMEKLKINKIF